MEDVGGFEEDFDFFFGNIVGVNSVVEEGDEFRVLNGNNFEGAGGARSLFEGAFSDEVFHMFGDSRDGGEAKAGHNFSIRGGVIVFLEEGRNEFDNLLLLFC